MDRQRPDLLKKGIKECTMTQQEWNYPQQSGNCNKNSRNGQEIPWVMAGLAALNLLVFLYSFRRPEWAIGYLADSGRCLMQGEYYRLLSSMFLHVESGHLFNNLLLLYFAGEMMEKEVGHIKSLLICLGAGLCGNLLSDGIQIWQADYVNSLGASGVVFGIFGALLWIVLQYRGRWKQITLPRICIMLLLTLYNGFTSVYVDNAAHVGGLAGGFLLAMLLYRRPKERANGG